MWMNITKMHADGNDFVIVDGVKNMGLSQIDLGKFVKSVCHRRFGVGADGVVFISLEDGKVFFRYFNRDGNEAGICGNGLRCFSRYVVEEGYVSDDEVEVNTLVGVRKARVVSRENWIVETYIGKPEKTSPWKVNIRGFTGYYVDVGVPHFVIFVNDLVNLNDIDVEGVGRQIRYDPLFSEGANVDFAKVVDENNIFMRTYERGVEQETLSCGTGAVSTVFMAKQLRYISAEVDSVNVKTLGGELKVSEKIDGYYIKGRVMRVYDAKLYMNELITRL